MQRKVQKEVSHLDFMLSSFEANLNAYLDVKYHHKRFSSRLEEFMRISHAVVVTPGGIGTLLDFSTHGS